MAQEIVEFYLKQVGVGRLGARPEKAAAVDPIERVGVGRLGIGTEETDGVDAVELSALRLATFVPELTMKGAWPLATFRPNAVAPAPVFVLVSCSALPAKDGDAVSEV